MPPIEWGQGYFEWFSGTLANDPMSVFPGGMGFFGEAGVT
jgi:hypothetical protein